MTTLKILIYTIPQVKFEKKYDDHAEDARRFEIFKNKLHEFEEHNEKFKKGELSWSVGVNQFTDLTEEEFAKMNHGLKVPEKH